MSQLHRRIAGLIVAGLLTACSSTMPQSAAVPPDALPSVTPEPPGASAGAVSTAAPASATASATPTAEPTPEPSDGPVTASMAKLQIDGERYATLGDPNAPITVVEFSDYG